MALGTPAISQLGGNLIVSMCDFTQGGSDQTHLSITNGTKTIFTNNIIVGPMGVTGKASVSHIVNNNADG